MSKDPRQVIDKDGYFEGSGLKAEQRASEQSLCKRRPQILHRAISTLACTSVTGYPGMMKQSLQKTAEQAVLEEACLLLWCMWQAASLCRFVAALHCRLLGEVISVCGRLKADREWSPCKQRWKNAVQAVLL